MGVQNKTKMHFKMFFFYFLKRVTPILGQEPLVKSLLLEKGLELSKIRTKKKLEHKNQHHIKTHLPMVGVKPKEILGSVPTDLLTLE